LYYKYTTFETAKIILNSGKLRWSSPLIFNDVSEFKKMPIFKPSLEETKHEFISLLADHVFEIHKLDLSKLAQTFLIIINLANILKKKGDSKEKIISFISKILTEDIKIEDYMNDLFNNNKLATARVLCVTKDCLNDAMWAHYASNHSGCVLEFRHLPEYDTSWSEAREVKYINGERTIGSCLDFLLYGDTPELRKKTVDLICYTKNENWSYEKEWRLMTWRTEEKQDYGDYKFYPQELVSVTFGINITEENRSEITTIIQERYVHCALYKVFIKNGELQLKDIKQE